MDVPTRRLELNCAAPIAECRQPREGTVAQLFLRQGPARGLTRRRCIRSPDFRTNRLNLAPKVGQRGAEPAAGFLRCLAREDVAGA